MDQVSNPQLNATVGYRVNAVGPDSLFFNMKNKRGLSFLEILLVLSFFTIFVLLVFTGIYSSVSHISKNKTLDTDRIQCLFDKNIAGLNTTILKDSKTGREYLVIYRTGVVEIKSEEINQRQ